MATARKVGYTKIIEIFDYLSSKGYNFSLHAAKGPAPRLRGLMKKKIFVKFYVSFSRSFQRLIRRGDNAEMAFLHYHATSLRSEERRVGKECRSRWSRYN